MGIINKNFFKDRFSKKMDAYIQEKIASIPSPSKSPKAYYENRYGNLMPTSIFDGEKTPFDLGTPFNMQLNYYALRARAWEAYLKTDFVQNAIRKYILWVVGPGLKLQSEPVEQVLKSKGINITPNQLDAFRESAESQFRLYANTKESTYSKNDNLHDLAETAMTNAILAGDCLVITRLDKKTEIVNTQIIDGGLISTPVMSDFEKQAKAKGNEIKKGIEVDKKGTHVAFYVAKKDLTHERVVARQSDGTVQAWLLTGLKSKENDIRGMSLLTAVLETSAKMDRFKDATLTNAEQNAKIVGQIVHDALSDGSNPMINELAQRLGKGKGNMPDSVEDGEIRAAKIAELIQGTVFNMGQGQEYKQNQTKTDPSFKDFFGINIDVVYATLGIPPEVAKDLFGGAYSGSRAALKSWEYKMNTDRIKKLDRQFYGPVYDFWLNVAIVKGDIQALGYLKALIEGDFMLLAAYRNKRFIGATVPHIDPKKEADAERTVLGPAYKDVPLTTAEKSTENLNRGDYNANIKKSENELEIAKAILDSIIRDGNIQQ
jgi:capsid protein